MTLNLNEIWALPRPELRTLLENGHKIDPQDLSGWAYHGVSLGLPSWLEALTWKTFTKAFVQDENLVRGWNIRMKQTGPEGKRVPTMTKGRDKCFGPFAVHEPMNGKLNEVFPQALILDYGAKDIRGDFMLRSLRDPLVALERDNPEMLLGCSWLRIAGAHFSTPSYFTLQRAEPLHGESVSWNESN